MADKILNLQEHQWLTVHLKVLKSAGLDQQYTSMIVAPIRTHPVADRFLRGPTLSVLSI